MEALLHAYQSLEYRLWHIPVLLWLPHILLALMFIESALDKIAHQQTFVDEMTTEGIAYAKIGIWAAIAVELAGAVSILTGGFTLIVIGALSVYILVLSFIYFAFWKQTGHEAFLSRKEFLKNLALIGGLIALAQMGRPF
jgi:putative oxidoreductase